MLHLPKKGTGTSVLRLLAYECKMDQYHLIMIIPKCESNIGALNTLKELLIILLIHFLGWDIVKCLIKPQWESVPITPTQVQSLSVKTNTLP